MGQLSPCTTTIEPILYSLWAATTEAPAPKSLCSATREATAMRSPWPQLESSARSPQLEKACTVMNKQIKFGKKEWLKIMPRTSVQSSRSAMSDSVPPWIAARQASLSITNSRSSLKLISTESVMPSSHLILCRPLLLLPSIFHSIRVFSNESTLHIRWPKYWSFSFSISPSNEHPGLISFRMDCWISLQSKGLSRVFSNTTVQKHQFLGAQLSSQSNSHIHT